MQVRRQHRVLAVAGLIVASLVGGAGGAADDEAGFTVQWKSKMMLVHREGDAAPRVDLETIAKRDGAFAIGPLAGLRGEITAVDGVIHVSRVKDDTPAVSNDWAVEAPFLVYGYVKAWKEVPLPASVKSPKDLEAYLAKAATEAGIDADAPFPFKVHVPDGDIQYHIMNNPDEGYTITRPHHALMTPFEIKGRPATVIGVYSTKHAGVFTHHGDATHLHVVSDDDHDAGHIDTADFGAGAKLFLPVP